MSRDADLQPPCNCVFRCLLDVISRRPAREAAAVDQAFVATRIMRPPRVGLLRGNAKPHTWRRNPLRRARYRV